MVAQGSGTGAKFKFSSRGNYLDGRFLLPSESHSSVSGEWVSRSPADANDEIARYQYSYSSVDDAVKSSRQAFESWRHLSQGDRIGYVRKFQEELRRRGEELSEAIAREVGKPLWETRQELASVQAGIDATIEHSLKLVAGFQLPEVMQGTLGTCEYRPLGVMAVIGPFNLPLHFPTAQFVPALLTGNTVIFKPSEKAATVGQLIVECIHEAGFPKGVFNLIQGEREVGRRLCVHEGVDGILFTGSYETGTRIKQDTLQQHWKRLALEMGAKNPTIVWEDADLELALREALVSAFITAGQRCTSTSRIIIHNSLAQQFIDKFHERAKLFTIGNPLADPFMGPMIESAAVDRYMKFLGIAAREGFELIMRGKALDIGEPGHGQGCFVTPSIAWHEKSSIEASRKSVFLQTEFFAPAVAVVGVDTVEEAIAQANTTQYGLVSSVFTRNAKIFRKCHDELQTGLINWNRGTIHSSPRLPFGGLKKSGSHFPSGLTSALYCTAPVSSLETSEPLAPKVDEYPGLNG